jgi:glycosyltransferase involved in cell wall biosynthesis
LTTVRLVGLRKHSGFRGDIYDATVERLVRRCLDLWRPDLVHVQHWFHLTGNLVAICAELRIPSVITLHDQWTVCSRIHRVQPDGTFCSQRETPCASCVDRDPWQTQEEVVRELGLRRRLIDTELLLARRIIVPSAAQQRFLHQLTDLPIDRLHVIPLGSPEGPSLKAAGPRQTPADAPLRVGYWGYLTPLKGPHLLLEAAGALPKEVNARVEWHLLGIANDQAYLQRLQGLANGLPVIFHGPYRHATLIDIGLDVAVFPSLGYETYSFVLDEAFQMGIPVIVPDRGAPAERIGQAGITFACGDAEDLARRIHLLLEDAEMLERLRHAVPKQGAVSMETHAADIEKIYQDTVTSRARKRATLEPYRLLLQHREEQLRDREQQLADRQREGEELSRRAARLAEELADSQAKLHHQIAESQLLRDSLGEREQQLLTLRADLEARTAEASALREQVGERDRQLLTLRADLEARTAEASAFREQVGERDRQLADLARQVQEQGRLLLTLRADLEARTAEASAFREQVGERDRQLTVFRGSILGSLDASLRGLFDRANERLRGTRGSAAKGR